MWDFGVLGIFVILGFTVFGCRVLGFRDFSDLGFTVCGLGILGFRVFWIL